MITNNFFRTGNIPLTSFYFNVKFEGRSDMDSSFQEVSGLKLNMGLEQEKKDGDNNFILELPSQPTYSNLILKRSLVYSPALDTWCKDAFENFNFDPKNMKISLLGQNGGYLASWHVKEAYPISWELTQLDRQSNQLMIETLELKYQLFKREQ